MSFENLRRKFAKSDSIAENVFDSFEKDSYNEEKEVNEHEFKELSSDFKCELEDILNVNEKLYSQIKALNAYQQQAIFDNSPNAVLSAMVGSGKTTVIIYKILYLHIVKQVPLDKMMVLTFTNKAAKEIQYRLEAFLSDKFITYKDNMRYFGTFHSVSRQIIKEHSLLSGLKFTPAFSILDKNDSENIINQIIIETSLNIKYQNKILKRIDNYIKHKDVLMGNMKLPDDLLVLIKLLRIYKQKYNLLDFNDLLSVLVYLLKKKNDSSFEWIIVDEFQDCNDEQIEILSLIKNNSSKEFLVGDSNQSIYAWRGSSPILIDKYIKANKSVMMNLPLNYRSSEKILSACSFLLMNKSSIKATKDKGSPINVKEHYDDMQEAYYLSSKLKNMKSNGAKLEDIAILFRTKNQISVFETVFKKENIEYNLIRKLELKDVNIQYWFFKLLACGVDNNRLDSLIEVFTNKEFSCLKLRKKLIAELHSSDNKIDALKNILLTKKNIDEKYIRLIDKIQGLKSYLLSVKTSADIDFISYFDIALYINPTSLSYEENYDKLILCQNEIVKYIDTNPYYDNFTVLGVCLDTISLEGSFNVNNTEKKIPTGVNLMTIHAAKGLEFEYVFLSGANDGLIPLKRTNGGKEHLKEEKRLLFVALTRAKKYIEVSFHSQPKSWNTEGSLSYFFNLIPDDLLEFNREQKVIETTNTNLYNINDRLKHSKYGEAIVISCTSEEIVCDFVKYGTKKFNVKMAALQLSKP